MFACAEHSDSLWIRECGHIHLPCSLDANTLVIEGERFAADKTVPGHRPIGLEVRIGHRSFGRLFPPVGPFIWRLPLPKEATHAPVHIRLRLLGVYRLNTLAWLARIFAGAAFARSWQKYRPQRLNKCLRIRRLATETETIVDFSARGPTFDTSFVLRRARIGINLIGWFNAALGVGESVRCAARAAAAANIPHALVPLRLYCKAAQVEHEFDERLQAKTPHPVNIVHGDAPQSGDIAPHHGTSFLREKYTIGYWAWELPEFPDTWVQHFAHVQEIWTPSLFSRDAIAAKSPVPVLVMPHAVELPIPSTTGARTSFGLPEDRFLFLFAYDLNSYSERKNPAAVVRAFRTAFGRQGRSGVGLVIKVHGIAGNEQAFAALQADLAGLEGCTLIAETLPRQRLTLLQATCDAFVSLHRSEGFGLNVAECMFLGKPVVSTDWSATAEFVTPENGCPVRASLVELTTNHGPYSRGQRWAEPDSEHAAWHMTRLVQDAALRQRLGAAAAATMRAEFSAARIGARYSERLRHMALWTGF